MKKKSSLIILVFTLILSLLAGCNSGTNTTGKETVNKESSGPVEIEFWYGLGGKLGETMEARIKEFNDSQNEVLVKGIAQGDYSETYQKLQAAIAAKKAPAAVLLTNDPMVQLANRELLAPLDDMIAAETDFNKDDFIPAFFSQGTINGKQFSLPLYGTTQVMYYRTDLFEKAGITKDYLKTWEDLGKAAEKIKKSENIFGWEPMWGSGNLIDAALSNGGTYLSEDGKTVTIDSPEWVDSWEFFRKAIHEDKTMRIHHGGQGWEYWYKTIDDVMKGNAAGYTGSSGDQGDLDFTKVAAYPQPGWIGKEAKPHAGAQTISIPAITPPEQQEAAFKWIKFFTSAEKTADWSMKTGYISVRKSAQDVPAFKEFAKKNPQILIPLKQAETATPDFVDPTGGKILDALSKAADKVEIEGVKAETALNEAKAEAQKALDQALKGK